MTAISVVGLGKLGAPLLAVLASSGFDVCGIDLNAQTVEKIDAGVAPVDEPHLQEYLTAHKSRIRATTDWNSAIGGTDVTCILVPTPSGADGAFDNRFVLETVEEVGRVLKSKPGYHLVVINSTVMPGSVGGPIASRLVAASGKRVGRDIGLCYSPEFIALGSVIRDLLNPDFVLVGESDAKAGAMLECLWRQVIGDRVPIARMNFVNAELTKISVNTYVTTKISFANMISEICDKLDGADSDVVTAAIGRDTRIGRKYLRGATAYGGPCFPRDTVAFARMAQQIGVEANLAMATQAINGRQLDRLMAIIDEYADPKGPIAILGLAYKPDTPVMEHAQGLMLAAALANAGRRVIVHDPVALDAATSILGSGFEYAASAADAVAGAETVAVMIPSAEYKAFFSSWNAAAPTRLVIDCWRLLPGSNTGDVKIIQLGNNPSYVHGYGAAAASLAR